MGLNESMDSVINSLREIEVATLVKKFREQATALKEIKASAGRKQATALKGIKASSGIDFAAELEEIKALGEKAAAELKNPSATGVNQRNMMMVVNVQAPRVANAAINSSNVTDMQNMATMIAQAAIDSGSVTDMQGAIEDLRNRIADYQKNIITPGRIQLTLAHQSGDLKKVLELTNNISGATAIVETMRMQIARIEYEKKALTLAEERMAALLQVPGKVQSERLNGLYTIQIVKDNKTKTITTLNDPADFLAALTGL